MRLALDIGGTSVKCALVDDTGTIARTGENPTAASEDTGGFADSLMGGVRKFLGGDKKSIALVGAGMAGFVDGRRGVVYESPNLPGVKDFELGRILNAELGVPSYVDNDATSAAWGEFLFGGHEGVADMLVVTLGTGIGGGLVLGGRLHRGARGFAGEIGQIPLYPDGPDCPCGGKGCLERYIGKGPLEEEYRLKAGLDKPVEPRAIKERADLGDRAAIEAWDGYGSRLGVVLAGVTNLLDLGAIVLTGGILGAWDNFSGSLSTAFNRHLITPLKNRVPIKVSSLQGKAGLLGAAFLDKARE
jgi:glucokinase